MQAVSGPSSTALTGEELMQGVPLPGRPRKSDNSVHDGSKTGTSAADDSSEYGLSGYRGNLWLGQHGALGGPDLLKLGAHTVRRIFSSMEAIIIFVYLCARCTPTCTSRVSRATRGLRNGLLAPFMRLSIL
jgi:hypothetical protein